jgi:hypothetical protein
MTEIMEGVTQPITSEIEGLDPRGPWNVVENLASAGNTEDAQIILRILEDPVIRHRLKELAQKAGFEGGYNLAEQSALEALENQE